MACLAFSRCSAVFLAIAASSMTQAEEAVPSAYHQVAANYDIPAALFYAIALAESGKTLDTLHVRRPWPWTLNVAGEGNYFRTRWEAWCALDEALRAGRDSVDVGLMQVNWRFHQERLGSSWLALDPYHNLGVGAQILKECYQQHRDWWASVGCYHAPADQSRAKRYRDRVAALWRTLPAAD